MRSPDADVLIAGGGLAAQRCCETLRRNGFDGRIVMLCEEPRAPYDRPPLSKGLLTDGQDAHGEHELAFKPPEWHTEHDIQLLLGHAAHRLYASERKVSLRQSGSSRAQTLCYRRLVIATGSRPRKLPGLPIGGAVHELRTRDDALSLRAALRAALRAGHGELVVLGAGLVGMEVASSARALGLEVTLVEAAPTPLTRALPPQFGRWLAELHREHGVDVRLATSMRRVALHGRAATLELSDGTSVSAGTVLVAAGAEPATAWLAGSALGSGLANGPIHTDRAGRTAIPDVYAAGDAACFPDPFSGELIPTPHWEAAAKQGATVARAILGLQPAKPAPAMFWSDQHGRRLQFVGHAPARGEIELDGEREGGGPFAAWITQHGVPAAALLVDRPDALPQARRRIGAAHTHAGSEEALRAA